uniref:Uncharacterized protein n=1 Tax=Magallana gigas TaxID=29159 RepID=A0A8W8ME01_MAGGI
MRSKRMSAAQKAAKAKERRKLKTENLPSLEGDSLKNPGNSCSLSGTMAETNKGTLRSCTLSGGEKYKLFTAISKYSIRGDSSFSTENSQAHYKGRIYRKQEL